MEGRLTALVVRTTCGPGDLVPGLKQALMSNGGFRERATRSAPGLVLLVRPCPVIRDLGAEFHISGDYAPVLFSSFK